MRKEQKEEMKELEKEDREGREEEEVVLNINITGPADVKTKGWKEYTVSGSDLGSPSVFQWSTSQSFKYMEEKGNSFKFYVDGTEYFERNPIIFCNLAYKDKDPYAVKLEVEGISTPAEDAPVPVAKVTCKPIATGATYRLDGSKSDNTDGCVFTWIVDTDQLYTGSAGNTLNKTLNLATVINKSKYQLDGARGYVHMNVTLQIFKGGYLVSEDSAKVIVPDSVIDNL